MVSFFFSLTTLTMSLALEKGERQYSPTIISMTPSDNLLTEKWLDQWPIGNGKFGGLVGGSVQGDIIPLSMAGFYVPEGKPGPQRDPKFLHQQFRQSRQALVDGNFQESQKKMSDLVSRSPLGMFQYIGDLSLLFSPSPLLLKQSKPQPVSAAGLGRTKIWNLHTDLLTNDHQGKLTLGKSQFSRQTLDTKNGIVKSLFSSQEDGGRSGDGMEKKEERLKDNTRLIMYTSRTWYASAIDDVLVGKFQCRSDDGPLHFNTLDGTNSDPMKLNKEAVQNCLHFSFRFSRTVNKNEDLMPDLNWKIEPYTNAHTSEGDELLFGKMKISSKSVFAFHASLTPSSSHKEVELSGAIICLSDPLSSTSTTTLRSSKNDREGYQALTCNSMREAYIVLTIQSSSDRNISTTSSSFRGAALKGKCQTTIAEAIALGPSQLKKRHTRFFNEHSSHSELFLTSSPHLTRMPTSSPSFASQLTTLYWFNKYLLLSSSSRSVSNLQGLWSDGPWNPWNSDYHLNINLQMMYWPTYSLGLQHAITSPLFQFIQQISVSGQVTAKQLYDCSDGGWVGHGFTDDQLDMGIRGDMQWALCVTCGSWLALHLWDHLTYTPFDDALVEYTMNTMFPIYRSMIKFYLEYLFEGPDGYMHTGPTTSPENSFAGSGSHSKKKIIQYLAFSPAIDMSVLRQVTP
jgi:hypothetical protein